MSKAALRLVTRPMKDMPNMITPDEALFKFFKGDLFKFFIEGSALKLGQVIPFAFLCNYVLTGIEVVYHVRGDYWLCVANKVEYRVLRGRQDLVGAPQAHKAAYFDDMVLHSPQWFETVVVPRTTLRDGTDVPSFKTSKYLCGRGEDGLIVNHSLTVPILKTCFRDADILCNHVGATVMTEDQREAIATNVIQQGINWRSGRAGSGRIYRNANGSADPDFETTYFYAHGIRRWHELSNGERIFDFSRFTPEGAWPTVDLVARPEGKMLTDSQNAMYHLLGNKACNEHSPISVRACSGVTETQFIQRQLI